MGWMSRFVCSSLSVLSLSAFAWPACAAGQGDWAAFKARFLRPDGRVVDTGNGGVSHSEGQSYAMLLATAFDDREAFERAWGWARANLKRPDDALLAWKWEPGKGVTDANDAADGDLVAAWALARAGERWKSAAWREAGLGLAEAVAGRLVREQAGLSVLLPGAFGFTRPDGAVVLNPSYMVFPAFRALAAATGRPVWGALEAGAEAVIARARFGPHGLAPDWAVMAPDGTLSPWKERPARFGYDAVRVPLYAMWGGKAALLAPYRSFYAGQQALPGWVGLDGTRADYAAGPGQQAVALAARAWPEPPARWPALTASADYYQSALLLLTRAMDLEREGRGR